MNILVMIKLFVLRDHVCSDTNGKYLDVFTNWTKIREPRRFISLEWANFVITIKPKIKYVPTDY